MLPENLRNNPALMYGAAAAIVAGLFLSVYLWLRPEDYSQPALYVCDSCNAEFKSRVVADARPVCPKCSAAAGAVPTYYRCPSCSTLFEAYRTRPTDEFLARDPNMTAANEVRVPGKTQWIRDIIPAPGGKTTLNPDFAKAMSPTALVCPKCGTAAAPDKPFLMGSKAIE